MPLSVLAFTMTKPVEKSAFLSEYNLTLGQPGYSTIHSKETPSDPEVVTSVDELKRYFPDAVVLDSGPAKLSLGIKIFYPRLATSWYMRLSCWKGVIAADLVVDDRMLALGMQILKTVVSLLSLN